MAASEPDATKHEPLASEGEHIPPAFKKPAFHCPYCGVLSPQRWDAAYYTRGSGQTWHLAGAYLVQCNNCKEQAKWIEDEEGAWRMVLPLAQGGPRPHHLMPADVRVDYEEARSIVQASPRGAGALARLAAQRLVDQLEPGKAPLNDKIASMVKKGLPEMVQQSLDALRVVGNNCVHPGEMLLNDDVETVVAVMECMNIVVEDRIARPQRVTGLFTKLPAGIRKAIEQRDNSGS